MFIDLTPFSISQLLDFDEQMNCAKGKVPFSSIADSVWMEVKAAMHKANVVSRVVTTSTTSFANVAPVYANVATSPTHVANTTHHANTVGHTHPTPGHH